MRLMTSNSQMLINVIRGYEFAFNATGNKGYLVTYLKLVKLYNSELETINNVYELKAA